VQELLISPFALGAVFLAVSLVYSSVGLGGGSTYTAMLAIFGASHRVIPTVSLTLNTVVTLLASINYIRHGHARLRLIAPFVATSMPMAYLGGSLEIAAQLFYFLLLITLVLVGARIYLWSDPRLQIELSAPAKLAVSLGLGALLGFVAGAVGIGGGIYLVPLIIIFGLGDEKEAAATGAVFILLNSVSGLGARLQQHIPEPAHIAPLVGAVVLGALVGSQMGAAVFEKKTVRRLLGLVILVAIVLLAGRLW
jgi:uncharacterized protein